MADRLVRIVGALVLAAAVVALTIAVAARIAP